ncbi:MAG TPA: zinc-binding dehydrogenase [Actinomycetota bacterium]|jgi:threonine dehydrogenase-like Zn-dependent dehydrogenase|nr:zinc-binding dehydrogenase [Actinomycetota bacterium]
MQLAVLTEPGRFELEDATVPQLAPDEVLVKVAACGVCASELDMFVGLEGHASYPWRPGHEVSGVVQEVGRDVVGLAPGTPVATWVTERGYSEFVAVKAVYCFPAGDVPLEYALGEPLACAVNAVNMGEVRLGDDVVIIGAGFMGHLVHKLVELQGPRQVIVADTRADALKRAESFGATRVVDVSRESLADVVDDLTDGVGADVTFEVTGVQAPLEVLHDVTRMSGTVAIVGYHQGAPRSLPLGQWNWKAFRVANAHFRELGTILAGMRAGMRLLTSKRLRLDDLVTHTFSLPDIGAAFRTSLEKPEGFVKATVTP